MSDDQVIHSMKMAVGQLDVTFEWWGYALQGDDRGRNVPTRTIVKFPFGSHEVAFVADDQLWIPGSMVRSAVLAYLVGAVAFATGDSRDRAYAALRAANNGKLPPERRTT